MIHNAPTTNWLEGILKERGWSIRELARRAKISHTYMTRIASGEQMPSLRVCRAIGKALGLTQLEVAEKLGIVSVAGLKELRSLEESELIERLRGMTYDQRRILLEFARFLGQQREEQRGNNEESR